MKKVLMVVVMVLMASVCLAAEGDILDMDKLAAENKAYYEQQAERWKQIDAQRAADEATEYRNEMLYQMEMQTEAIRQHGTYH